MTTIHHRVEIDSPAATVYEAIASPEKIGTWWDKQTVTRTDVGVVLEHNPGPEHGVVKLRVVELVPAKRVEWECVSTHRKTSPASAWTRTHFVFEITERSAAGSTVDFRQTGYDERSEFFETNTSAWGEVLQSLKRVLEARR